MAGFPPPGPAPPSIGGPSVRRTGQQGTIGINPHSLTDDYRNFGSFLQTAPGTFSTDVSNLLKKLSKFLYFNQP